MSLKPSRYPSRASVDRELIYSVLDAGLFCTIAFNRDGIPHQIPTGYCRIDDNLYIHGSSKSHFMDSLIGQPISYSVTHLDALVLAPTAFDHSFNYRSVIGFSEVREITDEVEKQRIFKVFTDRYIPGRLDDVGEPTLEQISVTKILEIPLKKASIKSRSGDANLKDLEKYGKWVGLIPYFTSYGQPEIDEQLVGKVELPEYINQLINQ